VGLCSGFTGTGSQIVCSGHGSCSGAPNYRCVCENGFSGYDCSKPICPTGRAWFEEAKENNVAHLSPVECSNAVRLWFPHFDSPMQLSNITVH
jgi:hypothetical protein